jgi:hypothetical protein
MLIEAVALLALYSACALVALAVHHERCRTRTELRYEDLCDRMLKRVGVDATTRTEEIEKENAELRALRDSVDLVVKAATAEPPLDEPPTMASVQEITSEDVEEAFAFQQAQNKATSSLGRG